MATDYHDFKITELERIAEEQISKAEIALGTGENDATELVRRWSNPHRYSADKRTRAR
jgi:hypothetical protein